MLPRAAIPASHDPSIVVLSVIVSIAGACAAVHLVERLRNVKGRAWAAWLAGAAAVDGIATWSTSRVGVAFRLASRHAEDRPRTCTPERA